MSDPLTLTLAHDAAGDEALTFEEIRSQSRSGGARAARRPLLRRALVDEAFTEALEPWLQTRSCGEQGDGLARCPRRRPWSGPRERPDIVLLDTMMPGMNGDETMRAMRSAPKFDAVPIIAVTAKALKEARPRCLQAGAPDYLPKPVDTPTLFELIRVWTGDVVGDA